MFVSILEPLGFNIQTAQNGKDAVEKVAEFTPDLVLMDLLMPVMDGHKALRQICDLESARDIKIIGISAAVADRNRIGAFSADCDDFVAKPVDEKVLLDKLQKQLHIEWIEEKLPTPEVQISTEQPKK